MSRLNPMLIVHYHTLVVAHCTRDPDADDLGDQLKQFVRTFIADVGMHVLIDPQVQLGPYGFTGIAGIVTSHIAFHYFQASQTLQFDVYSCKPYKLPKVLRALHRFWDIKRADILFVKRAGFFAIEHYTFDGRTLRRFKPQT